MPLPGTSDERAVRAEHALEVFLAPSDFPDALARLTLAGDGAAFGVNLDVSARRGEAVLSRVRWPRLGGRVLQVTGPSGPINLAPLRDTLIPTSALEAEDVTLEWYLQPQEGAGGTLLGTVRAVRLASASGMTLIAWVAPPEASGCRAGAVPAGEPRCLVPGVSRVVRALSVHPSGRWLAVAGGDLRPRVDTWSDSPVEAVRRIAFPPWLGSPVAAAYTPDGRHLIVADGGGTIHLWDADSGGGHRELGTRARSFVLLDAGRLVAASDSEGGLTIWRVQDGTIAQRLGERAHGPASLLAASGDGQRLAALAYDEAGGAELVVWQGARVLSRVSNAGVGYVDLALDATGGYLMTTHDSRGLLRHRVSSGEEGLTPFGGAPGATCRGVLASSPDHQRIACATATGVTVLSVATGTVAHTLSLGPGATEPLSALAFSPDGTALWATGGGALYSWSLGATAGGPP